MKEDPLQTCPEIVHNNPASASASAPNLDQRIKTTPPLHWHWPTHSLNACFPDCCFVGTIIISSWSTSESYYSYSSISSSQSSYSSWSWCSSRLIDLDYPHQSWSIRPVTSTNHESSLRPRPRPRLSQHSALLKPGSTGPHTSTEPRYHSFNLAYLLWTSTACSTPINFSSLGQLTQSTSRTPPYKNTHLYHRNSIPSSAAPTVYYSTGPPVPIG